MSSLTREQGPGTAHTFTIECFPIIVFPVSIVIVTMPGWPIGCFNLEEGIDHLHGIEDARIIRCAETKTNKS
jgi:hypothetical protein